MNLCTTKHSSVFKTYVLFKNKTFNSEHTEQRLFKCHTCLFWSKSRHHHIIKCKCTTLEMKVALPIISTFPSLFRNAPSQIENKHFFAVSWRDLRQMKHDKKCSDYCNMHRGIAKAFYVQLIGRVWWGGYSGICHNNSHRYQPPFVFTLKF